MADLSATKTEEERADGAEETSVSSIKQETSDEFAHHEEVKDEKSKSSKRKLSTNSSSEDDDVKLMKLEDNSVEKADQIVDDDFNSCNEDEDSYHSEESEGSTDDPRVLDDILSIKKMELLQHPEVIAFLQEKMEQTKKKGK